MSVDELCLGVKIIGQLIVRLSRLPILESGESFTVRGMDPIKSERSEEE